MDASFQSIWEFLLENPLDHLNPCVFNDFLEGNKKSFDFKMHNLDENDLIRFLFLELENILSSLDVDEQSPREDQLLEAFMTIVDYYTPVRNVLKKVQKEILSSPLILKETCFYGRRISSLFIKRFSIQKMSVPPEVIPFSEKVGISNRFHIPDVFLIEAFSFLCIYFLNIFLEDDSDGLENTMAKISETITYLELS